MNNDEASILIRKKIGVNVGRIRSERNVSQSELSRITSINRSHINRLENGRCNVSIDVLVKIADALDVPLARLFAGLDACPPHVLPAYEYHVANVQSGLRKQTSTHANR